MGKPFPKDARICSAHFIDSDFIFPESEKRRLKCDAYPSKKLPVKSMDKFNSITSPVKKQHKLRAERAEKRGQKIDTQNANQENVNPNSSTPRTTIFRPNFFGKWADKDERAERPHGNVSLQIYNEENVNLEDTSPCTALCGIHFLEEPVDDNLSMLVDDFIPRFKDASTQYEIIEDTSSPTEHITNVCDTSALAEDSQTSLPIEMCSTSTSPEIDNASPEIDNASPEIDDAYIVIGDKCIQVSVKTAECSSQTLSVTSHTYFFDNIKSEEQLSSCTGLNSFQLLSGLCSAVTERSAPSNNRILLVKDQVLMTLMKLKLNCSFVFLSVCFNVSRTTCSRYFESTIGIISSVLRHFVASPSRDLIRDNLPYSFKYFPNTIFVLDCTEVPVCAPACIRCRTQCWSQYKKRHTVKVLIGITPDGVIIYVGPCYGGKASDNFLFKVSGLLDQCQAGDCIMVDKGFGIENECEARGVTLIRPAFKENNEQLGYEDCELSRKIASARVHVERIMERIKNYRILQDEIQWNYLQYIDQIVTAICGIVNLSRPILSDKAFEY